MNIGIFYGSNSGNTKYIAEQIAKKLEVEAKDISKSSIEDLLEKDILILGTSTWGQGDLQDDWDEFLPQLEEANLNGKTVALFGLGDQEMYPDEFVDGLKILEDALGEGVKRVGFWENTGYNFDESRSLIDEKFIGLVLDEDNQEELSEERIKKWVEKIKSEI